MNPLVSKMLSGDRMALSRLITHIESRAPQTPEILASLSTYLGRAQVVGITGPPGAGKSTLVDQMIVHYRKQNKKVGVVAVDPSSPFSGGALLGDRIRMMNHAEDSDVFIRSLGSRGAHGGLSRATRDVVRLFDAFGMDVVIVETVGVGQTEMDVLQVSHTTVVVLTPESGDTIQTLKAGILEAADVLVVNKSDRDGSMKIQHELMSMIEIGYVMHHNEEGWEIPVLALQANQGLGVAELVEVLRKHYEYVLKSEEHRLKQEKVRSQEFVEILEEILSESLREKFTQNNFLTKIREEVKSGKRSAFDAALQIKNKMRLEIEG